MTRPAPVGRRLHPLSPLLRGGIFVAAVGVGVVQQLVVNHEVTVPLLTVAVALGLGLAYGACSWWFTRYRIDRDELRIDSGILVRRSRRIRIERLQAVDVAQPLLARIFSLAELKLEVAGGSKAEAPLAFLRLDEAGRLRELLLSLSAAKSQPAGGADREQPGDVPIVTVGPGQLLAAMLLTTRWIIVLLATALLAVAVIGTGAWWALTLVLPAALTFATGFTKQFAQEYGFSVTATEHVLRIRRGLFDLSSQTVPAERVQAVSIRQPILWRRLDWVRLQVDVAGYGGGRSTRGTLTSTLLPVGGREVADEVIAQVLPGVDVPGIRLGPVPRRARWARPVGWWTLQAGTGERAMMTSAGWLTRVWSVVPHGKTQSVRIRQGPWQRRLRLATVHIDSPPGPVQATALHRDVGEARRIMSGQLERARSARASVSAKPVRG